MYHEIFIAGSGGQGILSLGRILALSACEEGRYVTYYPSYGAEIRGGTANCVVKISNKFIYSPVVEKPTELVLMNFPSYTKFIEKFLPEKFLFINSTLVPEELVKKFLKNIKRNIEWISIQATEIANKIGDIVVANMVMLGKILKVTEVVRFETLKKVIETNFRKDLVELNMRAVVEGMK